MNKSQGFAQKKPLSTSTVIILYTSADGMIGFMEAAAPTLYLHYEQMCQKPELLIQQPVTNG